MNATDVKEHLTGDNVAKTKGATLQIHTSKKKTFNNVFAVWLRLLAAIIAVKLYVNILSLI